MAYITSIFYPDIDTTQFKLLYVLKVDDNLWIGSGIYLPGQAPLFSFEDQQRLLAFVDEARDYALKNGKNKSLKVFNDPEGEFVRGGLYVLRPRLSSARWHGARDLLGVAS